MIGKSRELYFAQLPSWLRAIVVGVSMPCFFAISGMFAAKTLELQEWPKIFSRLSSFLWPMLSFGVVFGLWSALRMKQWSIVLMSPFSLWCSLWFLRTLVIIYLGSAVLFGLARTRFAKCYLFAFVYAVLVFLHLVTVG